MWKFVCAILFVTCFSGFVVVFGLLLFAVYIIVLVSECDCSVCMRRAFHFLSFLLNIACFVYTQIYKSIIQFTCIICK